MSVTCVRIFYKLRVKNINWDTISKLMRKPSWVFDTRTCTLRKLTLNISGIAYTALDNPVVLAQFFKRRQNFSAEAKQEITFLGTSMLLV